MLAEGTRRHLVGYGVLKRGLDVLSRMLGQQLKCRSAIEAEREADSMARALLLRTLRLRTREEFDSATPDAIEGFRMAFECTA